MSSVRRYLVLVLLAIITLVIFFSATQSYRNTISASAILFDRQLQALWSQSGSASADLLLERGREALEAGAVGFSTGRSDVHKASDGDWTPSSEASTAELVRVLARQI